MKIAYMFGALRRGGTETLMLDLFRNGQTADFQFIGIHRKGGEYEQDFYSSGQKLFRLTPRFPLDIFYLLKLRKLFKTNKIDIIHSQVLIDTFYAKIATLGTQIKVLQTVHGFDFGMKGFSEKIFAKSLKITVANIFVSNYQKNYYIKKYGLSPENQYVVYNCISFDKIDNQKEIVPLLPEKSELLIGSVGNFVYTRTQIVICRFLKLLSDAGYDFRFVFAGLRIDSQAHLYDDCVNFCRTNGLLDTKVFFLGGRNDIANVLRQLDAFVYSSAHDTFGIAVAEAMVAGVPIFVNDWGVMSELTANGEFGTVYLSGNPQDLFEKFTDFIKNREIYKQKAQNANNFVRENFSVERIFKNLSMIYKNII